MLSAEGEGNSATVKAHPAVADRDSRTRNLAVWDARRDDPRVAIPVAVWDAIPAVIRPLIPVVVVVVPAVAGGRVPVVVVPPLVAVEASIPAWIGHNRPLNDYRLQVAIPESIDVHFHVVDRIIDAPEELIRPASIDESTMKSGPTASSIKDAVLNAAGQAVDSFQLVVKLVLAGRSGQNRLQQVDPAFQDLDLRDNDRKVRCGA